MTGAMTLPTLACFRRFAATALAAACAAPHAAPQGIFETPAEGIVRGLPFPAQERGCTRSWTLRFALPE